MELVIAILNKLTVNKQVSYPVYCFIKTCILQHLVPSSVWKYCYKKNTTTLVNQDGWFVNIIWRGWQFRVDCVLYLACLIYMFAWDSVIRDCKETRLWIIEVLHILNNRPIYRNLRTCLSWWLIVLIWSWSWLMVPYLWLCPVSRRCEA